MKLDNVDGYSFEFPEALDAIVFDKYHQLPMKGVDIVVEFADRYLFVELKDYENVSEYDVTLTDLPDEGRKKVQDQFKWLKNYLKYKFRDTFLFRYAESKDNKPVYYICLINFDNALASRLQKALRAELPLGLKDRRWQRMLARECFVLNHTSWACQFPKWPVVRVP